MGQLRRFIETTLSQYFMIQFPVTSNSTIKEKDGAL
jgi:hypothetical protein